MAESALESPSVWLQRSHSLKAVAPHRSLKQKWFSETLQSQVGSTQTLGCNLYSLPRADITNPSQNFFLLSLGVASEFSIPLQVVGSWVWIKYVSSL